MGTTTDVMAEACMADSVSSRATFRGLTGASLDTFRNDGSFLDAQEGQTNIIRNVQSILNTLIKIPFSP